MIVADHSSARPTDSRQNLTKESGLSFQHAFVCFCQAVMCWVLFGFLRFSADKRTSDGHRKRGENFLIKSSGLSAQPTDQSSVCSDRLSIRGGSSLRDTPLPPLRNSHPVSVRQEFNFPKRQ